MCVKYLFQLDMWTFNDITKEQCPWWVPVIGIQKVPNGSFARSEILDFVLLLLLIFHRHVSQILATWDYEKLRWGISCLMQAGLCQSRGLWFRCFLRGLEVVIVLRCYLWPWDSLLYLE